MKKKLFSTSLCLVLSSFILVPVISACQPRLPGFSIEAGLIDGQNLPLELQKSGSNYFFLSSYSLTRELELGATPEEVFKQLNSATTESLEPLKPFFLAELQLLKTKQKRTATTYRISKNTAELLSTYDAEKNDDTLCQYSEYKVIDTWVVSFQKTKDTCKYVSVSDGSCGYWINYKKDPFGLIRFKRFFNKFKNFL